MNTTNFGNADRSTQPCRHPNNQTLTTKKRILICLPIAFVISTFQFVIDRKEHLRLQKSGIITNATSFLTSRWDGYYADFTFTTLKGQNITGSQKCGGENDFDKRLSNFKIIYNSENPEEFQDIALYKSYYLIIRVVFYFIIYTLGLTFVFFGLFKIFFDYYDFKQKRNVKA